MDGFRAAAEAVLAKVPAFDLKTMQAEQERLTSRQKRLGACDDAVSMWRILGIKDPEAIRDMDGKDLPHSRTASRKPTMTLDEILKGLFPFGHDVKTSAAGFITGTGKRKRGGHRGDRRRERRSTGTAGVLPLAEEVLRVVAKGGEHAHFGDGGYAGSAHGPA